MQEFMGKKESMEREQVIASQVSLDSGQLNLKPVMDWIEIYYNYKLRLSSIKRKIQKNI